MERAAVIHQTMVAEGFTRERDGTTALRFSQELDIRGRPVGVEVTFADDTLTRLPRLRLLRRAAELPEAVAHLEADDGVCYVREEELQLDPLTPGRTVALIVIKMREALDRIASKNLSDEIQAEFPQHWLGSNVLVDLPSDFSGKASLYEFQRGGALTRMLARDAAALKRFGLSDDVYRAAVGQAKSAAVRRHSGNLSFRRGERRPETLAEVRAWCSGVREGLWAEIAAGIARDAFDSRLFFVHADNGTVGGHVVLPPLATAERPSFLRRLLEQGIPGALINRMSGSRMDEQFVFSRNLRERPNLGGLNIALVGAGTIGGTLAKLLAQSAAGTASGQLVIYDPQMLTPGNVGRHLLGIPAIGLNKAEACKAELQRLYPDNDTQALAQDVLESGFDPLRYDLIVNATGEQAVGDVLAQSLETSRRDGKAVPVMLHGWLEGNGVAARSLLSASEGDACLRCLRQTDGTARYQVLRDDHPAILTPANCGEGAYFAYGPGAPAITAGLMVQMLLDWRGGHPDPTFRTVRIVQAATMQVKDQNPVRLTGCPVCGPFSA